MIFNYKEAANKRFNANRNHSGWDLDILTHVIFLAAIAGTDNDDQLSESRGIDLSSLDMKLTVNGIEVSLEKGLQRVVGVLNDCDQKIKDIEQAALNFSDKLSEIVR